MLRKYSTRIFKWLMKYYEIFKFQKMGELGDVLLMQVRLEH